MTNSQWLTRLGEKEPADDSAQLRALQALAEAYPESQDVQQFLHIMYWRLSDRRDYGRRLEAYINEAFPKIEEIRSAAKPYRTFGVGFRISHFSEVTISDAVEMLFDRMTNDLQAAFGPQQRTETFYWRERPRINVWMDWEMNAISVGLWVSFAIEGWQAGESLAHFLSLRQPPKGVLREPIGEGQAIRFWNKEEFDQ